jgi:hypothetical protein
LLHEPRQRRSWLIFDVSQKMKHLVRSSLVLLALVWFSGCPKAVPEIDLLNASGRDASITSGDERLEWKSTETLRLPPKSKRIVWKNDGFYRPWLIVKLGDETMAYSLNYVLPSEWNRESIVLLELRADLCLYVIHPRGAGRKDPQPAGFPLHPQKANKAPEPTSGSVTPRAILPKAEMKHRNQYRSAARGAPAPLVAHL